MQHLIFKPIVERQQFSFFRSSKLLALFFSSLLYLTLGILFIDFQIEINESIIRFLKTLVITSVFILFFKISFPLSLSMTARPVSLQQGFTRLKGRPGQIALGLLLSILLHSCNGQPLVGVNKDLNTGMVTTYSKVKPEETVLVMNEEKLGHTQIPLGEDFIVVNTNVKGLVVKENKISIGCSLLITDTDGKELLREEDLFKANTGIYDEKAADYLKCTVSTGKPMEYEKKYNVVVRFWDKYGSGSIENRFAIDIIDLP